MAKHLSFVGFDAAKKRRVVALAEGVRNGEIRPERRFLL